MSDMPPPNAPPPATPPPAAPPPPGSGGGDIPPLGGGASGVVHVDVEAPLEIARWRPFVHWLLGIPLMVVLYVYGIIAMIVSVIGWFAALFSGRLPDWAVAWITGYGRFQWRVTTYTGFLREPYVGFAAPQGLDDPGADPAIVQYRQQEELSRGLLLVKWLILLPHYIVLSLLGIAVGVVHLVAAFAILFTGAWPEGMRRFVIGYYRWSERVYAYLYMLSDEYPPFSLD